MRIYSPATSAYLARRSPVHSHALVWVAARNRGSGEVETIGFWTGDDHRVFVIGGEARTYYGAGSALSVDPIRARTGLKEVQQRITLSGLAPEVQMAIRGYDPRHARVEVHRALFDPETLILVDEPDRKFKGHIDKVRWPRPAKGERSSVEVIAASGARALATPLTRKRSDATLRARSPDDGIRKYASQADAQTPWGRNK